MAERNLTLNTRFRRSLIRDLLIEVRILTKHPSQKIGNDQEIPLLGDSLEIVQRQPRTADRIFPHNPRSVSTNFTRAVVRSGVADLHFHDLRHEGISRLLPLHRVIG